MQLDFHVQSFINGIVLAFVIMIIFKDWQTRNKKTQSDRNRKKSSYDKI